MWAAETRKRLSSVLAEAYTDIRDNHSEPVQLDKFLAITAPQLPVVPANDYLAKMGWMLTRISTDEATITRSDAFNADVVDAEYPSHTNKSSLDLVNFCYESGLVQRSTRLATRSKVRANVMAMPIAAAPPAHSAPVHAEVSAFDDLDVSLHFRALLDNC
jgi:hypothetical protein